MLDSFQDEMQNYFDETSRNAFETRQSAKCFPWPGMTTSVLLLEVGLPFPLEVPGPWAEVSDSEVRDGGSHGNQQEEKQGEEL